MKNEVFGGSGPPLGGGLEPGQEKEAFPGQRSFGVRETSILGGVGGIGGHPGTLRVSIQSEYSV